MLRSSVLILDAARDVDRVWGRQLRDTSRSDGFRSVYNLDITNGYIEEDGTVIMV